MEHKKKILVRIREFRCPKRFLLIDLPSQMDSEDAILTVKKTVKEAIDAGTNKPSHVVLNCDKVKTYDESLFNLLDRLFKFAEYKEVDCKVAGLSDSLYIAFRKARKEYLVTRS